MDRPAFADISDYSLDELRKALAFLESGTIDCKEAKRRFAIHAKAKVTANNTNRHLLATKLRKCIRSIDACRAKYPSEPSA